MGLSADTLHNLLRLQIGCKFAVMIKAIEHTNTLNVFIFLTICELSKYLANSDVIWINNKVWLEIIDFQEVYK
jgi:hypothetical protein